MSAKGLQPKCAVSLKNSPAAASGGSAIKSMGSLSERRLVGVLMQPLSIRGEKPTQEQE
jgi:hypothetical protein